MSEISATVKTYLALDTEDEPLIEDGTPLATLLPGGIYLMEETGRLGIDRTNNPDAFDETTKKMLPLLVITDRGLVPNQGVGKTSAWATGRAVLEFYFENDGDDSLGDLFSARTRVFSLLQAKRLTNITKITFAGNIDGLPRAADTLKGNVIRSDYVVQAIIRP